jgi:two-component system response regulator PilR (NtrC family)
MKALVVDDEQNIRKVLRIILSETNFSVVEAASLNDAMQQASRHAFDIALVDLRLPDGLGIDAVRGIKSKNSDTCVIVITAFASADNAVEAMKAGAYDYLIKPFNVEELRIKLRNLRDNILLKKQFREIGVIGESFEGIIGNSEAMHNVYNMIQRIAPYDTSVLITGESGTGKELVAKAIHRRSQRAEQPFVTINCASLPSELLESELFGYTKGSFTGATSSKHGLIEEANGGTLFLDEIGEMPHTLQAKLLRFLEDKKIRPIGGASEIDVDVRVIAASNKDLNNEAIFRKDLFFRIAAFQIKMPPLRERKQDIPALADYFIKTLSIKFSKEIHAIDPSFMQMLMQNDYEGNVRELRNIIERAIIMSDDGILKPITDEVGKQVCMNIGDGFNLNDFLLKTEQELLYKALALANNVKTKAAELLGISFREFRYRLSKFEKQKEGQQDTD